MTGHYSTRPQSQHEFDETKQGQLDSLTLHHPRLPHSRFTGDFCSVLPEISLNLFGPLPDWTRTYIGLT